MIARIDRQKSCAAVIERLRDTRGFMIGEQLVSIIFIGLLCIAVTAGLQAAMNSYSRITLQTQADAMLQNAVEVVSNELVYALSVEGDEAEETGEIYFVSATRHETAALQSRADGIWLNAAGAQACIAAAENGLAPQLEDLVYHRGAGTGAPANSWTFRIAINSGSNVLAETTMTVKRIGS